jgi:hypothetical protein
VLRLEESRGVHLSCIVSSVYPARPGQQLSMVGLWMLQELLPGGYHQWQEFHSERPLTVEVGIRVIRSKGKIVLKNNSRLFKYCCHFQR